MKSSEHDPCSAAQPHYLDYHCETDRCMIPATVIAHIQQCPQCQSRARKVNDLMHECGGGTGGGRPGALWLRSMKMHFAYLGKPVDCRVTRFFMPSLLLPGLALRVPTPITSHIQTCKKCSERLEWLKSCCLTLGQLQRFHLLVENETGVTDPAPGETGLKRLAELDYSGLTGHVVRQTLRSQDCFRQIYERRERLRPLAAPDTPFEGDHLTDSRFFDLIVPECDESSATGCVCQRDVDHVRACPECYARMQLLYLEYVVFLNDTGVNLVTISRLPGRMIDWLTGRPVTGALRVEIAGPDAKPMTIPGQGRAVLTRRRVLLGMTTAAAVILVTGVLSFLNPGAKAVDPDQINRLMAGEPRLRIEKWEAETGQITSLCWQDRIREQTCQHRNDRIVFHDLKKRIMITLYPDGEKITETLNDRQLKVLHQQMAERANFNPGFDSSRNGDWVKVQLEPGQEVYELSLPAEDGMSQRMFRIYLEPGTCFIHQYDAYFKNTTDKNYRLETRNLITRVSEADYLQHVTAAGFDPDA